MTKPTAPQDLFPAVTPIEGNIEQIKQRKKDFISAATDKDLQIIPSTAPSPTAKTPPQPQMPGPSRDLKMKSTNVPVPDTTQLGMTPQNTPGRAYTDQNNDWQEIADRAPGVTAEQTVQGQLAHLFQNPDAQPIWDYAHGIGTQYANSRGLLNSDIAAEAASQAVYAQAMPIAQQDANTYAARAQQEAGFWQAAGLQAQQATIASALQAQDHLEQMAELARQGDINSRLQLEQYGYNFQLNEQQNLHNMQLAALQGDIQSRLALQQFGFNVELMAQDYGYRMRLSDLELRNALRIGEQQQGFRLTELQIQQQNMLEQLQVGHRNTLEQIAVNNQQRLRELEITEQQRLRELEITGQQRQDEIDAAGDQARQQDEARFTQQLQQNYLGAVENRTSQFSAEVQSIYSQQGLTAAQQANAVNVARTNYLRDLAFIKDQYDNSPYWDDRWSASPISTPQGPYQPPIPGGPYQPPPPNPGIPPPTPYQPPPAPPPPALPPPPPSTPYQPPNRPPGVRMPDRVAPPSPPPPAPSPTVNLAPPPAPSSPLIGGRRTAERYSR